MLYTFLHRTLDQIFLEKDIFNVKHIFYLEKHHLSENRLQLQPCQANVLFRSKRLDIIYERYVWDIVEITGQQLIYNS